MNKQMNEIFYTFCIIIFILSTLNCCLRIKILEKMKRINSYQKQWSQIEMNEYNLTQLN
jgi:hypothetical protein